MARSRGIHFKPQYGTSPVQEAIRETLPSSTVVEIAHRLHTVVEADRILVMSGMAKRGILLDERKGFV
jgi:ABC-type transport system involved in Fe-S cluster assembly fused permease/ATPase subunit